ncbi:hypothetical protein [Oerskovia sp. KBS0722]|uniref:hypothetical protein n=1 Tax=Oerskovia sp. KBS0722 TaxID=1179673 RepID=UPI00110D56DE|nr:hypothetical protein [Oerskovia sp. KBS0722]QDW61304.1 hypothetical protein FFI11_001130 [Oerskovia sp. KBS0722]
MARKPRREPTETENLGSVSSFVGMLVGLPTAVALVVALFLDLPDAVVWTFAGMFVLGLVTSTVLDVVGAVRGREGAWGVLWAGVSSPFRYTFGWLRLLPVT